MAKLTIKRGTTYLRTGTYSINGILTTLVGATVRFTMKTTQYDSDATDSTAVIAKNITTGTAQGAYTVTINPVDTALLTPNKYYYDIKVENADGTIYDLDDGTITLTGSPTNRYT